MKNKTGFQILCFIPIGILILLFIFNLSDRNFFKMDFYKIASLTLVLYVSYFLTQRKMDDRRNKDIIMDILRSIANETYLMDKETLNSENSKIFIMKLRDIENKNDLLSKIANRYGITDEVIYIREEIQRIDDIVSNHLGKKEELETVYTDIERYLTNIRYKKDAMLIKVFFEA